MPIKIGIIGTRGIPNRYGGFEQLAQYLSVGLVQKGHTVVVYNGHDHPYQQKSYEGVQLVHCHNPEGRLGTAGQFIYDLNCIRHARRQGFDVLLFLGYTSSSVWGWLYPRRTVVVSNMDGLEWRRSKYGPWVRRFLRYAEKLAVRYSQYLIADSPAIQQYLQERYGKASTYIAYGAEIVTEGDDALLVQHGLRPQHYCMLMARMEPENNVAMVLEGFAATDTPHRLVVVGNMQNRYGQGLLRRFGQDKRIVFTGAVFDTRQLQALKQQALLYFHGHSAGGTNPSLLEAMASQVPIAAHDNVFNRAVLEADAFYFAHAADVGRLVQSLAQRPSTTDMVQRNFDKIQQQYNWPLIIDQYERLLVQCSTSSAT
jgi:glycosyltransferase involved in cell wall biosynthesis